MFLAKPPVARWRPFRVALLAITCLFALSRGAGQNQVSGASRQEANTPEIVSHELQPAYVIRAERNLILVRTVVRQRDGRTVGNLSKEDFRVFDNGKLQEITGFSVENGTEPPAVPETAKAKAPALSETPPSPGLPGRYVALLFDDLHLRARDAASARVAAGRFLASSLGPGDRAAVFTTSGDEALDFTDDRNQLQDSLSRIRARGRTQQDPNTCPDIWEYQAYLIAEKRDAQAFNLAVDEAWLCDCEPRDDTTPECRQRLERETEVLANQVWNLEAAQVQTCVSSLDGVVRRLSAMPGERNLVLVSAGFFTSAQADVALDGIIERALRSDIVMNTIDARGLYLKSVSSESREMQSLRLPLQDVNSAKTDMLDQGLSARANVLSELAESTGGDFFEKSNDMNEAFRAAGGLPVVSYVLSFSPSQLKPFGKFHTLKVKLVRIGNFTVEARRGYFAPPKEGEAAARGDDTIEKLVFSQDELHGLPVDFRTKAAEAGQRESNLVVVIDVKVGLLKFRKENGRNLNTLTFDTVVFDRNGRYVTGNERSLEFQLKDATLSRLSREGFAAETNLHVPPGRYTVREVVKDSVAGDVTALNHQVEVASALPPESPVSQK